MLDDHVYSKAKSLFYYDGLALAALLVMLYTNDIFTPFSRNQHHAACALIMYSKTVTPGSHHALHDHEPIERLWCCWDAMPSMRCLLIPRLYQNVRRCLKPENIRYR